MSFWFCARPLHSPYTVRQAATRVGKRSLGENNDTITVANFEIRRRRPEPYVDIVTEVAGYLDSEIESLSLGFNLFDNRLPQRVADDSSVSVLVDSVLSMAPRTLIGKALKYEYPRVQLVGVGHSELDIQAAESMIQSAYILLGTTFNRNVGE